MSGTNSIIDPPPDMAAVLAELRAIREAIAVDPPALLEPAAAARLLGVSVSTIHAMNADGRMPAPVQLSERLPRFCRSELLAWIENGCVPRSRWNVLKKEMFSRRRRA